ncbi:FtsX-like permease family protein [Paractinoplanes brasiliensis]|uniref:Putative ABC transport system permease protein n=1 Tax=Paractinoplanes brasiliensis TaxID=52695 RepID=A0A4R6JAJ7_9ACTN|nr:FtsX-like permease family protein [Actinoplanes brasiliensis]TDO32710.1 putative ABC transport system permease protein [Actinoplanes brasiliensis]GID32845.1 transporter [Actinoplanes brasiliensis]
MIAVALRNLRHRPGGFVATFLSSFLGAALIMAFASLLDTASGVPATGGNESLVTTALVGGGWCLVIVAFAVTSTLSLAVRRRSEQIALLRRAGATWPQIGRMVVGEAAAVALLASAAAVPVGWLLGRVLVSLLKDTGQVASDVSPSFAVIALGMGFGVTLLGSLAAGIATARRVRAASTRRERPRLRRAGAVLFLLMGANCSVLTVTIMDGRGIDAMQTAGQAGIWAAIGLALLAPELLRLVTVVLGPLVRASGVAGSLAVTGVHSRTRQLASAVMPVLLFTGVATGTVYMQGIEDRAAEGQVQAAYARDIQTLNYVVVGMITLFVAIMLVNTLVAATAHRRREFAQHRLAGATRGQVLAMVSLEGVLITVTGVLGGLAASMFTILPFGSARADRLWPSASPWAFAVIALSAVALTASATIHTTRRTLRTPATTAVRA